MCKKLRKTFESEVNRWIQFVSPVSKNFHVKSLVLDREHKHRHEAGLWHLYSFWSLSNESLKIGIAGPNSAARYNSQHYNSGSARSNLAKSLIESGICSEPAKQWIVTETYRINVVFSDFSAPLAHALESHLHLVFRPRFEK